MTNTPQESSDRDDLDELTPMNELDPEETDPQEPAGDAPPGPDA